MLILWGLGWGGAQMRCYSTCIGQVAEGLCWFVSQSPQPFGPINSRINSFPTNSLVTNSLATNSLISGDSRNFCGRLRSLLLEFFQCLFQNAFLLLFLCLDLLSYSFTAWLISPIITRSCCPPLPSMHLGLVHIQHI